MGVRVTIAPGYDAAYPWKTIGAAAAGGSSAGYYMSPAEGGGEPPGRWWGKGAEALGLEPGSLVERQAYDRVVDQRLDPRDGVTKLGRSPTSSPRPSRLTTPALSAWPYWPPGDPRTCQNACLRLGRGSPPRPREGPGDPAAAARKRG